ncbi:unnamed protein product, partial [Didymodactylos carnosus]
MESLRVFAINDIIHRNDNTHQQNVSLSPSTQPSFTVLLENHRNKTLSIPSDDCQLSLRESDQFFCEYDVDWERRKKLYHLQHGRNRVSDARFLFFQNNWEPNFSCEFERRLGNIGDGGKWVCDVHHIQSKPTCLIYSFGSNGDFSFENAIKSVLPKCEIHTFDMGVYHCPPNVCTFHQAKLGDGLDGTTKSLEMIINQLNHTQREIDILKVDIEGAEFSLFFELFKK